MTIDEHGRKLWQRILPAQRWAFFCCILTGYLTHLFVFTNVIPNADGMSRVFDPQQMTIAGRWFLHYTTAPNAYTQMPAAIALLSMVFLGLAAALVVDLLAIRSKVLAGLTGAIMAAFPSMGFTFLYTFTASAYCIGIFLAVLSIWLAAKGRLGLVLGAVALALSMGVYQAYVTIAIGLALLVVLKKVLDPNSTFRTTLTKGLELMGYLAVGAILYYVILLIFLKVKHLELWSYLGMDSASGSYPFAQIPALILDAYKQVVAFFFVPGTPNAFTTMTMVLLDLAALVLGLLLFLNRLSVKRLWKEKWRPITALAMVALLPLGINFTRLLSPYSDPTPLMKYPFVIVYLALILLASLNDGLGKREYILPLAACWSAALLVFCLNTNNLMYTASAQAHRATQSYVTRLMARVESCPGYEPGMEVLFIGAVPQDQIYSQVESYSKVDHYSVPLNSVVPLNKHLYYYLEDWLNVPIKEPNEEIMISVSNSKAFRDMPLYPQEGSVQVLDGRLVVKLQPEYKPKTQFELDYEQRH